MTPLTISNTEARNLIIDTQLLNNNNISKLPEHLSKVIKTLGYIQIDTISVVERSHHHILWSRMNNYSKGMLDELLKEKKIFEYWSHAAAYLPIRDYKYSIIRKKKYSEKYKAWRKANVKIVKHVYERIKNEGPLQSKDFEGDGSKTSGWWNWKPAKDALDFLFHKGDLMVSERKGFQKVYDLTERVLPDNVDINPPNEEEFYEHLLFNAINSNAIISEKEITYSRYSNTIVVRKVLNKNEDLKKIRKIRIKGSDKIYYSTEEKLNRLNTKINNINVHILSPFDNMIINRNRLKEIFDFDYTIECYVPAAKRVYGYYCLPILYGNNFAGRLDAKADRASGELILKSVHFENKFILSKTFKNKLEKRLLRFAKFCGCKSISGIEKIR